MLSRVPLNVKAKECSHVVVTRHFFILSATPASQRTYADLICPRLKPAMQNIDEGGKSIMVLCMAKRVEECKL